MKKQFMHQELYEKLKNVMQNKKIDMLEHSFFMQIFLR